MTTTKRKTATMTQRDALALWKKLATQFAATERTIQEIIDRRAWEPLGYSTFNEAWNAQMGSVTLASELRPYVVYQMLEEGQTPADVAATVKGVGESKAKQLARQRRNGVPPQDASMYLVGEHMRRKPKPPSVAHVPVGARNLKTYQRICHDLGLDFEKVCAEALAEKFAALGTLRRGA